MSAKSTRLNAARSSNQTVGFEIPPDISDGPIPAAQIAAIYDNIDDANKTANMKPETIGDDAAPVPVAQMAPANDEMEDAKKVVANDNIQENSDTTLLEDEDISSTIQPNDTSNNEFLFAIPPTIQQPSIGPPVTTRPHRSQVESGQGSTDIDHVAIPIRPPPQPMLTSQSIQQTAPPGQILELEATLVPEQPVFDAIPIQVDETRWWKKHRIYVIVILALCVFGGMAAAIGFLVGSQNNKDNTDRSGTSQATIRTASTTTTTTVSTATTHSTVHSTASTASDPSSSPTVTSSSSPVTISSTVHLIPTDPEERTDRSSKSTPAPLIWKQQGQALNGETDSDQFGWAVALSSDSKTLAIGAPGDLLSNADRPGYVKIFRREVDGSSWVLNQTIRGKELGDPFGRSLALSLDGKTLAIGAPSYRANGRPGYASVYRTEDDENGLSWKQLGKDIIGEANGDQSGWSVSLNSDGRTVAIGANGNSDNGLGSGHVRVYHWDGRDGTSSWKQIGQDIDGEASPDNSGGSVALSADGKTLAIGANWASSDNADKAGHARVYHMEDTGSSWNKLGQDIDGTAAGDWLGTSVALSSDGQTLAVGAPGYDNNGDRPGYTRVYHWDKNGWNWQKLGQKIIGEANSDMSGASVSFSSSGDTLAVGAFGNDGNGYSSGHVRVYSLVSDSIAGLGSQYLSHWEQLGADINGQKTGDNAGLSVALSADGKTVAIGSPLSKDNGNKSGHVRVFSIES